LHYTDRDKKSLIHTNFSVDLNIKCHGDTLMKHVDEWTDGETDRQTDRKTDRLYCRKSIL